ncbi:MAG: trigger factor [Actinomycetota bacterium]|nr:trigger factor [Actinomycetota bacterium]
MKSAVETLSPTRARLTIEVPFEELQPSLDAAYKKIGAQVRVQGFRPGRVPARILDQRVGRGVILEEAIQDAVPRFYGQALQESELQVLGHPEVEVTQFADGEQLGFTAEVDVRPQIKLPDYSDVTITVEDADPTDAEIDEQINGLRDRFAVLQGVDRAVETGDFVLLDITATVDGEEVAGASATGLSYEVGSGTLMPGLDDAVLGKSEGESTTFDSELIRGEHAGRTGQIDVTVKSVKVKELPELDDEFAQTASEFDTIQELRDDIRSRMLRVKTMQQGVEARDKVLEALLERVEIPVPESLIRPEVQWRLDTITQQLEQAGLSREEYLANEGQSEEDFTAEIDKSARQSVQAQFLLDAVAEAEQLNVSEQELMEVVMRRAQRAGISPDEYAQSIVQQGQIGALMGEAVRAKALGILLERITIQDASGRTVDLNALQQVPVDAETAEEELPTQFEVPDSPPVPAGDAAQADDSGESTADSGESTGDSGESTGDSGENAGEHQGSPIS